MSDELGRHTMECDYCKGTGSIKSGSYPFHTTCPQCKGEGFITEDEEVN